MITERLNAYEQQMDYYYIDGFIAFVNDLHRRGVKTAVVTSSNLPKMESVYRKQPGFKNLFDAILTSEDFERSKPDPDCYLKAAQKLGVEPDECVVFEDSVNGLRSGMAAKMKVVGLLTTNPLDIVAPLSDLQVSDYVDLTHDSISHFLNFNVGR